MPDPPARATCVHSNRHAYAEDEQGRCRECHTWAQIDAAEWTPPQPLRVPGCEQYGGAEPPARCPKCDAGPSQWTPTPGAKYLKCYACGRDWHRVGPEAFVPPRHLTRQPRLVGRP